MSEAKKYYWRDADLSDFGAGLDKHSKKESSDAEKAWKNAGQNIGIQVWRVNKQQVEDVPTKDYGHFYKGDSYIVLNTYKKLPSDTDFEYDVHCWIGESSAEDEYRFAACKMVELDTHLNDKSVQHREIQGYESLRFKKYFKNYTLLEGGYESGFNRVKRIQQDVYTKRLLQFHSKPIKKNLNKMEVKEVPLLRGALSKDDVFILDLGDHIYQWNGTGSNEFEKSKANEYINKLLETRKTSQRIVLDEASTSVHHPFYDHLKTGKPEQAGQNLLDNYEKQLLRLCDAQGNKLKLDLIAKGPCVNMSLLDQKGVFILDCGKELWIWIGGKAGQTDSKHAIKYAHIFLTSGNHPCANASVTVLRECHHPMEFKRAFNA